MNNTVKKITFIFENLEHAVFCPTDIGRFSMKDLRHEICRFALNEIRKVNIAGLVMVEVKEDAYGELLLPNGEITKESALSRLKAFDDITAIEITYEDESSDLYYVEYEGDQDDSIPWNNIYQHSFLSDDGSYVIIVSKEKDILRLLQNEWRYMV